MSADVIPFPRSAKSLWDDYCRAFIEWERDPNPDTEARKQRAFVAWERAFVGRVA